MRKKYRPKTWEIGKSLKLLKGNRGTRGKRAMRGRAEKVFEVARVPLGPVEKVFGGATAELVSKGSLDLGGALGRMARTEKTARKAKPVRLEKRGKQGPLVKKGEYSQRRTKSPCEECRKTRVLTKMSLQYSRPRWTPRRQLWAQASWLRSLRTARKETPFTLSPPSW